MDANAQIVLGQEIPLILAAVDDNGNPITGAIISNVIWSQDNEIGEIIPDMEVPNKAVFIPSKAGTTHITATAEITVS